METKSKHTKFAPLSGTMAGPNYVSDNVATVDTTHHYNWSGSKSFGGASSWPVIKVIIAYPTDWEGNAHLFADKLTQIIAIELKEIARLRLEQGELRQEDYDDLIQELS